MSNYNEQATSSSSLKWNAIKLIQCFNDFDKVPYIKLHEVERTVVDGNLVSELYTNRKLESRADDTRFLKVPYINIETFEQILDPAGNPIEGYYFTPEQIYFSLACLYIAAAKEADKLATGTF